VTFCVFLYKCFVFFNLSCIFDSKTGKNYKMDFSPGLDVCGGVVLLLSASRQEVASFSPPFSQFLRQIFSSRHILYFEALRPQPQQPQQAAAHPSLPQPQPSITPTS
jgi:hypothetical protein